MLERNSALRDTSSVFWLRSSLAHLLESSLSGGGSSGARRGPHRRTSSLFFSFGLGGLGREEQKRKRGARERVTRGGRQRSERKRVGEAREAGEKNGRRYSLSLLGRVDDALSEGALCVYVGH